LKELGGIDSSLVHQFNPLFQNAKVQLSYMSAIALIVPVLGMEGMALINGAHRVLQADEHR